MIKKFLDRFDYLIRKSNFPILMLLVVFVAMCFIYMFQMDYFNRQVVKVIQFFIFDKSKDSLAKAGTYGDFIGGILGTLIGVIGAIYVYKTFKYQQNMFRKERFESRYFEMLKLYKDNINEMVIEGYELEELNAIEKFEFRKNYPESIQAKILDTDIPFRKVSKTTTGRKIFITTYNELVSCYEICKYTLRDNIEINDRYIIKMAYKFLYSGIASNAPSMVDNKIKSDSENIKICIQALEKAREFHSKSIERRYSIPNSGSIIKMYFKYKPYSGHASRFGHYYRHLFEAVKFVVKQEDAFLTYIDKREYLKLLRAQMSDHEQLMLYYNYLSGFGERWEKRDNPLDSNNYFSKYRMIHNIPIKLAKVGIDILEEFRPAIEIIRDQGIKEGKNYEMFEQLES